MPMSILETLFAKSPFGPLIEHAKKVTECIDLIMPITEAWFKEEWEGLDNLVKGLCDRYRIGWEDAYERVHWKNINQLRALRKRGVI